MYKMKFCPNCGFPINGKFKFCPECGKPLEMPAEITAIKQENITEKHNQSGQYKKKTETKNSSIDAIDIPSYVLSQLIYGEEVVYVCKIHWQIWLSTLLWLVINLIFVPALISESAIGAFILFAIFAYFFCSSLIEQKFTCLAVTNKRVICKFGFISRKTFEINLDKVEGVVLVQTFLGRIFDCSSVIVSGTGSSQAPVPNIQEAQTFKQILLSESEKYKLNTK